MVVRDGERAQKRLSLVFLVRPDFFNKVVGWVKSWLRALAMALKFNIGIRALTRKSLRKASVR